MKDAILALVARTMFVVHSLVAFWRVLAVVNSGLIWFLLIPPLALIAEGVYTVVFRGGQEYKWITPCMALYLLSVIPPIWFLEYRA